MLYNIGYTSQQITVDVASVAIDGAKYLSSVLMTDPRWLASEDWIKMSRNVNDVKIHFVFNTKTYVFDDFKFK